MNQFIEVAQHNVNFELTCQSYTWSHKKKDKFSTVILFRAKTPYGLNVECLPQVHALKHLAQGCPSILLFYEVGELWEHSLYPRDRHLGTGIDNYRDWSSAMLSCTLFPPPPLPADLDFCCWWLHYSQFKTSFPWWPLSSATMNKTKSCLC